MTEGLRVVQRAGTAPLSVLIERAGEAFEYEIKGRPAAMGLDEVAEVLFSVALDLQAKAQKARGG